MEYFVIEGMVGVTGQQEILTPLGHPTLILICPGVYVLPSRTFVCFIGWDRWMFIFTFWWKSSSFSNFYYVINISINSSPFMYNSNYIADFTKRHTYLSYTSRKTISKCQSLNNNFVFLAYQLCTYLKDTKTWSVIYFFSRAWQQRSWYIAIQQKIQCSNRMSPRPE